MRTHPWLKTSVMALALALAAVISAAPAAFAQAGSPIQDQDLAKTYAPVLYFHPDEMFRPQPVDVMIDTARLQEARPLWPDVHLLHRVTASDLSLYADISYNLNAWLGSEVSSDYRNYTAHRTFYQSKLSPEAGGPAPVAYAHVVRDEDPQHIIIQYWLFYWYNDAFNKHEGDWEMVQVILSAAGEPEWLVLSQHHGGTRRPWDAARIEEGAHPTVYVALGSHANYFWGDETYLADVTIGNARLEMADRTGTSGRTIPDVILIPDREEIRTNPARWPGLEWLLFSGRWGETGPQGDFSGPLGPADKGEQWERPHAWGIAQPLDTETWYANRLRVEISGQAGDSARVTLLAGGVDPLPKAEILDGMVLLHTDPTSGTGVLADIEARPGQRYDIVATWPDAEASEVTYYRFEDVPLGFEGRARLALRANEPPTLMVAETPSRFDVALGLEERARRALRPNELRMPSLAGILRAFQPTRVEIRAATWDAPDVMWAMGLLSPPDVLLGVSLSLLAGLLPALLYVGLLYWVDQYEKEPVGLLAAAFLWGAVPALLVAGAVRIFFRLPVGLLGPRVIEVVSADLVAPFIEQALTGAVVLFIAWRHRREFDDVLDGIIYGAVVGLGFAMTANILSYLAAFLQYGFAGLGHAVFVDGVLYGLNQALYAAILGAGLGYARLAHVRWQRWAVPLAAFALAIATRAFHNLAIDSTLGWNLRTVAVTWAGLMVVVAVMVWSLREQRRCLAVELAGEVPAALYGWLTMPGGCWRAEWRALWRGGLRGLVQARHAFQSCARLAIKKMQSRQPGESGLTEEIDGLRREVAAVVEGMPLKLPI